MRPSSTPDSPFSAPDPVAEQASLWLSRRDRGLTPAEQDAYLEWLRADPRHAPAISRLERGWGALDRLAEWRPVHSQQPNPDLLALPRRRWPWVAALAAAAALVLAFTVVWPVFDSAPTARVVRHSEVRTLADGSVVELNKGADIAVEFTAGERRIRLLRGEAHFTVAKQPERPFVVMAGDVRVRAVGTVFNVSLQDEAVDVLVTEGKVRIDPPRLDEPGVTLALNSVMVAASERARVNLVTETPVPPRVEFASPAEIEQVLSWQGLRIEFDEMPLEAAVQQFNRHSPVQLVVADRSLAALRIGGNFRADNADAFVRLLESGFGVSVQNDARGRLVLHASR